MSRKTGVLALAGGLLIAGGIVATANAGPTDEVRHKAATPVGYWEGTVQHPDGSGTVNFSFHGNGVMCLSSDGGDAGGSEGKGTWSQTGGNRFSYKVRERLYDGSGTTTGFVGVNQQAVQRATSYSSSGTSKVYDADGTYLKSVQTKVTAKRTSTTPKPC